MILHIFPTEATGIHALDASDSNQHVLEVALYGTIGTSTNRRAVDPLTVANGDIPAGAYAGCAKGDTIMMHAFEETAPGSKVDSATSRAFLLGDHGLRSVGSAAWAALSYTGNVQNGDQVTIGTHTYTFQDTLTDVDGNIHIGATAEESFNNLANGIVVGFEGGTPGVDFAASMTFNDFYAFREETGLMGIFHWDIGYVGNGVSVTDPVDAGGVMSWDAATTHDGKDIGSGTDLDRRAEWSTDGQLLDTDSFYSVWGIWEGSYLDFRVTKPLFIDKEVTILGQVDGNNKPITRFNKQERTTTLITCMNEYVTIKNIYFENFQGRGKHLEFLHPFTVDNCKFDPDRTVAPAYNAQSGTSIGVFIPCELVFTGLPRGNRRLYENEGKISPAIRGGSKKALKSYITNCEVVDSGALFDNGASSEIQCLNNTFTLTNDRLWAYKTPKYTANYAPNGIYADQNWELCFLAYPGLESDGGYNSLSWSSINNVWRGNKSYVSPNKEHGIRTMIRYLTWIGQYYGGESVSVGNLIEDNYHEVFMDPAAVRKSQSMSFYEDAFHWFSYNNTWKDNEAVTSDGTFGAFWATYDSVFTGNKATRMSAPYQNDRVNGRPTAWFVGCRGCKITANDYTESGATGGTDALSQLDVYLGNISEDYGTDWYAYYGTDKSMQNFVQEQSNVAYWDANGGKQLFVVSTGLADNLVGFASAGIKPALGPVFTPDTFDYDSWLPGPDTMHTPGMLKSLSRASIRHLSSESKVKANAKSKKPA